MTAVAAPERRAVLYRPESAVFWVFIAALVVGGVLLVADEGAALSETLDAQLRLAPFWLAFFAFMVWLMLRFDPYRSVRAYPQVLVAGTALGGTAALAMSMYGNTALARLWGLILDPETLSRWSAALTAPLVEEASKATCATLLLVLCASAFHRISHALLLGMFTGFGFDVMEDLSYATREAINSLDSDLTGATGQFVIRTFTAVPAHWAYTSLVTVGVLMFLPSFGNPQDWSRGRRAAVGAGLILAGPLMHFVWNSPSPVDGGGEALVLLAKVAFNLALFVTIALALIRDERRWVSTRIAAHADVLAGVDTDVLGSLPTRRGRRGLRRQARRSGGRAAAKAVRAQQDSALDRIQSTGWRSLAQCSSSSADGGW